MQPGTHPAATLIPDSIFRDQLAQHPGNQVFRELEPVFQLPHRGQPLCGHDGHRPHRRGALRGHDGAARVGTVARRGDLGTVLDLDASFTFTIGADAHDNYRWSPDQGGGALLDVGIYCLGPIVELWGADPDTIDATALWHTTGVDARTEATLSWADGREARIRCSFVDPEEQRIEVVGDAASMIVDADAHTGGHRATSFLVAGADGRVSTTAVEASDPYLGMVDAFARAVRGDEPWPRPMTSTLELLTLIERIASARR